MAQIPTKQFIPDFESPKPWHCAPSQNDLNAYALSLKGTAQPTSAASRLPGCKEVTAAAFYAWDQASICSAAHHASSLCW